MYEASLIQKWDYQNGMDYAVKTAVDEERTKEQIKLKPIAKSLKDDKSPWEAIAKSNWADYR